MFPSTLRKNTFARSTVEIFKLKIKMFPANAFRSTPPLKKNKKINKKSLHVLA